MAVQHADMILLGASSVILAELAIINDAIEHLINGLTQNIDDFVIAKTRNVKPVIIYASSAYHAI